MVLKIGRGMLDVEFRPRPDHARRIQKTTAMSAEARASALQNLVSNFHPNEEFIELRERVGESSIMVKK